MDILSEIVKTFFLIIFYSIIFIAILLLSFTAIVFLSFISTIPLILWIYSGNIVYILLYAAIGIPALIYLFKNVY